MLTFINVSIKSSYKVFTTTQKYGPPCLLIYIDPQFQISSNRGILIHHALYILIDFLFSQSNNHLSDTKGGFVNKKILKLAMNFVTN